MPRYRILVSLAFTSIFAALGGACGGGDDDQGAAGAPAASPGGSPCQELLRCCERKGGGAQCADSVRGLGDNECVSLLEQNGCQGDAPAGGAGSGGSDGSAGSGGSGGGTPMGPAMCDGTKYCSDESSSAKCENGVTRIQPCAPFRCDQGRCGACTGDTDCRGVRYLCQCADGFEVSGQVDSICGDIAGDHHFCSHPSVSQDVCAQHGGFNLEFGHIGTGCRSLVDP